MDDANDVSRASVASRIPRVAASSYLREARGAGGDGRTTDRNASARAEVSAGGASRGGSRESNHRAGGNRAVGSHRVRDLWHGKKLSLLQMRGL